MTEEIKMQKGECFSTSVRKASWRTAQEAFMSLYGDEWSRTLRAAVLTSAYNDRLGSAAGNRT